MKPTRILLAVVFGLLISAQAIAQLACTRFYPATAGTVGVFNNCNKCMTASMAWCDGSIHRQNVPANNGVTIQTCIGTITLVGESPCSSALSMKALEAAKPAALPTAKDGVKTLFSWNRVTTGMTAPNQAAGSSCSAHNDAGDTCSVTCPVGQSASCSNGTGASPPTCECR